MHGQPVEVPIRHTPSSMDGSFLLGGHPPCCSDECCLVYLVAGQALMLSPYSRTVRSLLQQKHQSLLCSHLAQHGWPAHSLHVCHTTCDSVPDDPPLHCPTGHPVPPGCGTKTAASLPCGKEGPPLLITSALHDNKMQGGRGVGETPTTGPLLITIKAWTALTHSTLNIFIYIYFK